MLFCIFDFCKGDDILKILGNIIWFVFGGLVGAFIWLVIGLLWCMTIVGMPIGVQCFKFAKVALFPFGKEILYSGSTFSFLINLIWVILFGLEMCIGYAVIGLVFCVTIIGIPFGKQFFKLAKLSLLPFGANIQ